MGKLPYFLAALLLSAGTASASDLDKDDAEALKKTQSLLANPDAMNAFAKDNRDAAKALDRVSEITKGNSAQTSEISSISSSVFSDLVKTEGSDPAAIQEKLQAALKDPGAFIKSLSPEQQARIRSLASELDKQSSSNSIPAATK